MACVNKDGVFQVSFFIPLCKTSKHLMWDFGHYVENPSNGVFENHSFIKANKENLASNTQLAIRSPQLHAAQFLICHHISNNGERKRKKE